MIQTTETGANEIDFKRQVKRVLGPLELNYRQIANQQERGTGMAALFELYDLKLLLVLIESPLGLERKEITTRVAAPEVEPVLGNTSMLKFYERLKIVRATDAPLPVYTITEKGREEVKAFLQYMNLAHSHNVSCGE